MRTSVAVSRIGLLSVLVMLSAPVARTQNHYVARAGQTPVSPFISWTTAASNIAETVAISSTPSTIWVSNGTYTITAQITTGNRIFRSFNNGELDRDGTILDGNYPHSTNRIFQINNAAALVTGFTITNGYRIDTSSSGNTAYGGGGVYMTSGTLSNCVVIGNQVVMTSVERGGGGVHANGSACLIIDCDIVGNTSNQRGGGVFLAGGAQLARSRVKLNQGRWMGGGVTATGSGSRAEGSQIYSNHVSNTGSGGGGVQLRGTGSLRNSLVWGNTSGHAASTGVYIQQSHDPFHRIEGCTIIGNVYAHAQSAARTNVLQSTIIVGSIARSSTVNCHFAATNSRLPSLAILAQGSGNITDDPLFVDAVSNNYRLRHGSPCINTGTNLPWMLDGALDVDGKPRLDRIFGLVDMGCFEYSFVGTTIIVR